MRIRDAWSLLRRWWSLRTGPIDQLLIAQANDDIRDPEWWTRRPLALCVHPLRQNSFDPKMIAASEVVDGDHQLTIRRELIKTRWGGRWSAEV
jgi:hypothetical protein